MQVLTFDFHNTLANCEPWFDLEVRDLPWAVIEHLDLKRGDSTRDKVERVYRQLRLDVIASGDEIDAYDSVSQVLSRLDMTATRTALEAAVDSLMLLAVDSMMPVPGAADTVRFLHADGVPMGVVSSAVHHQTLNWILERMGIDRCFQAVVTSASSGFYKSSPAIYDAALRELGGEAKGSVHVGDSLRWDVAMSQRAGMTAAWLKSPRREVFSAPDFTATPSLTLASMEQAGPLLVELLEHLRIPARV